MDDSSSGGESKRKKYLLQQAKDSNNDVVWKIAKTFRNQFNRDLDKAKMEYLRNKLNDSDPKLMWARVKTRAGLDKKAGNGMSYLETPDAGVLTEPSKLAPYMNEYLLPSWACLSLVRDFLDR